MNKNKIIFLLKNSNNLIYYLQNRLKRKKQIIKILSSILILVIICNIVFYNTSLKLTIYFVDVGQGDCTLIRTPQNKTILIDGGGSEFGSFDVGESILLPYLLDRRITKLDYIVISHFDSDHVRTDYLQYWKI